MAVQTRPVMAGAVGDDPDDDMVVGVVNAVVEAPHP
jgi:hypothetical protein